MREKIWFASDLHLGHQALVEKGWRPEGFEKEFFWMWESTVASRDVVWLLGDIAFGSGGATIASWFRQIKRMPGRKRICLGNHDRGKLGWYKQWGFEQIVPFNECVTFRDEYGPIMLTHIPAFAHTMTVYDQKFVGLSNKFERLYDHASCVLNLHGHLHGRGSEDHRTFDCTLECIGSNLIELEQIKQLKWG